jgi:AraC-like DNA-binding protein
VYVEAAKGIRHIGDHISTYEGSDLALIGSYIPHLNFDYGVKATVETVVVQLKENFLMDGFDTLPEMQAIIGLFEKAKTGLAFHGETKKMAGKKLKQLSLLDRFSQLMELLNIFQMLANSDEYSKLNARPISNQSVLKQQERIHKIYQYVETHFQEPIDMKEVSQVVNLTIPAFCRYFRKSTKLTYTDFVNQYKINHARKLLLQGKNVTEACFDSGFENLSYFNKTFRKITGENPSAFKKLKVLQH